MGGRGIAGGFCGYDYCISVLCEINGDLTTDSSRCADYECYLLRCHGGFRYGWRMLIEWVSRYSITWNNICSGIHISELVESCGLVINDEVGLFDEE